MSSAIAAAKPPLVRRLTVAVVALTLAAPIARAFADLAPATTTAWSQGHFQVDVPGVVGRSDVVLGQPNVQAGQALPLGNGALGAGVWSANGLTAQLNRADTMPDRLSPGQLIVPGLARLTSADDYHGRLDLYDGMLVESGGGMTAKVYVRADTDELVVDVTGADPDRIQTAQLSLWQPRTPTPATAGPFGALSQTWTDTDRPGSSGATFGAMAAVSAGGRDVQAGLTDPRSVQVSFRPHADGSFRVVVAAPQWPQGDTDALAVARTMLTADTARDSQAMENPQLRWWHDYWQHVGLMRLSSADGAAQYLENIRTVSLYAAAAERGTVRPGSQAGVADLFDSAQDNHSWDPASYWGWNLRMLVTASLGAGAFGNNDAYFAMYRDDLPTIESWTASQFGGIAGACTPETMRFNGIGMQVHKDSSGNWGANPYLDCSSQGPPNYNARTLSTGGEVALFIWQTYLATDDIGFLRQNYPVMAAWARFMLAYAKTGADGYLHTDPSNAHETQWDVHDPTTDIAAMDAVFPAVAQAATLLGRDSDLVDALHTALPHVLPFPRTDAATLTQQLPPSADQTGQDVIGMSYEQAAHTHNVENLGLEPVWPFGLISDDGPLSDLAKRTFTDRPNVQTNDWSFDPIQAARLGLADDMRSTLIGLTEKYQKRISGLASFGSTYPEQYAEQGGVVATALQDALVQDYDGVLRVAQAWPSDWDADATIYIQHRGKVDVQVRNGTPTTVVIEAGSAGALTVRNPWPGQAVQVVTGDAGPSRIVVGATTSDTFDVPTQAGHAYLVEPAGSPTTSQPFAAVTGTPATSYKQLDGVSIGLPAPAPPFPSVAAAFDNSAVSNDTATSAANIDGAGSSLSAQALAADGVTPGSTITHGGIAFGWPAAPAGQPDNVVAAGQKIDFSGSGSTLGFLATTTYGPSSGTGTLVYTDGSAEPFTLNVPDWYAAPAAASDVAIAMSYRNRPNNTQQAHTVSVYFVSVPLAAGKTLARIVLPDVSHGVASGVPAMHIFAIGTA
jgi:hypothetical protein